MGLVVPADDVRLCRYTAALLVGSRRAISERDAVRSDRAWRGRGLYARNFGVDEETAEHLMTGRAGAG